MAGMARELAVVIVSIGALFALIMIGGIVMLFRNRQGALPSGASGLAALRAKASGLLVQVDGAVADAENELGFAQAQFGDDKTADFASSLSKARVMTTAAFRLRKSLEDAFPETVTKQREMTLQIIALCESAQALLDSQSQSFAHLRTAEVDAPHTVDQVTSAIRAARGRIPTAKKTVKRIGSDYRTDLGAQHERALDEVTSLLAAAEKKLALAQKDISPTGVNDVTSTVLGAQQSTNQAVSLLDAIDATAARYDEAAASLTTLLTATVDDLAEARIQREKAPDPDTGSAIVSAIDAVEKAVAAVKAQKPPADPVPGLDDIGAALATLDTALAGARNQADRLEHARTALGGALASARSQITATRGLIGAGGRQVGADARTRLNEAERELRNAENESDPVDALDAARRAVTNARDADALARYDAMT
jgi:hypothetical protein